MDTTDRAFLEGFAAAIIDERWTDAEAMLAPWLQASLGHTGLEAMIERGLIEDAPPPFEVFEVDYNSSTVDDLRDAGRVFRDQPAEPLSVDEYLSGTPRQTNILSAPQFAIAPEITSDNFRWWGMLYLAPDPELEADVDYCILLYFMLVHIDGQTRVGHLEPELT